MNKFFVYGTLKVGGHFAKGFDHVRQHSVAATISGFDLYKVSGSFPGIVKGTGTVIGELHTYTPESEAAVLRGMDTIEGYRETDVEGSFYKRQVVDVNLPDGTTEKAFVYVFNRPARGRYEKVKDGNWPIK